MTRNRKINKTRNKNRKYKRRQTKKKYNMKKIYGGDIFNMPPILKREKPIDSNRTTIPTPQTPSPSSPSPISSQTPTTQTVTQPTTQPTENKSKFLTNIKEGINKIGSKVEKGIESLKSGIEYSGQQSKKSFDYLQEKSSKALNITKDKTPNTPPNTSNTIGNLTKSTGTSIQNVVDNLSGSENENEKKIKNNESEIEKLKKEKETADENRKNEINETILKLQEENDSIKKLTKYDVSKGLRNIGEGIGNFSKGLLKSFQPAKKIEFNGEEKEKIIQNLRKMTENGQLTENELNHLIDYLNQPQSVIPSGLSNSLKGLSNFIATTQSSNIPTKNSETRITSAMVPNYYENYSKTNIPNNDKLKISENIFLVNEDKSSTGDFIFSNLNSVDNFLAVVLNECSGSGCKSGQFPKYKAENTMTISDNREILKK
jgi:hypothetical protein